MQSILQNFPIIKIVQIIWEDKRVWNWKIRSGFRLQDWKIYLSLHIELSYFSILLVYCEKRWWWWWTKWICRAAGKRRFFLINLIAFIMKYFSTDDTIFDSGLRCWSYKLFVRNLVSRIFFWSPTKYNWICRVILQCLRHRVESENSNLFKFNPILIVWIWD